MRTIDHGIQKRFLGSLLVAKADNRFGSRVERRDALAHVCRVHLRGSQERGSYSAKNLIQVRVRVQEGVHRAQARAKPIDDAPAQNPAAGVVRSVKPKNTVSRVLPNDVAELLLSLLLRQRAVDVMRNHHHLDADLEQEQQLASNDPRPDSLFGGVVGGGNGDEGQGGLLLEELVILQFEREFLSCCELISDLLLGVRIQRQEGEGRMHAIHGHDLPPRDVVCLRGQLRPEHLVSHERTRVGKDIRLERRNHDQARPGLRPDPHVRRVLHAEHIQGRFTAQVERSVGRDAIHEATDDRHGPLELRRHLLHGVVVILACSKGRNDLLLARVLNLHELL
mmetsp:Transcript_11110/g.41503  ORF Transcript_11110/g.41503 Transcript_11110/m.41503 type:complete len:337 (+) Transcript_11110:69-1079(+)